MVRSSIAGKIKANRDARGKHEPKHKIGEGQIQKFDEFINKLPAVPSHYCRSSSKKLYLPADIKNFSNLYRLYVTEIKKNKTVSL